jgi:hypothetical protein
MKKITVSVLILISFLLNACSSKANQIKPTWYKPAINDTWHWQLQGKIDPTHNVKIYDIDLFDTSPAMIKKLHDSKKKVICYFSAGTYEDWRSDASLFPKAALGSNMSDWPGEKWIDIRNEDMKLIILKRLDLAKQKSCDGVEPDNVDGYTNKTGFNLTFKDQIEFNKYIAKEAHKRGLSIALKNDLNQIKELEPYFDFAINEQCHYYNECHTLIPFVKNNKMVFNVEYSDKYVNNTNYVRDNMCLLSKKLKINTIVLPILLDSSFHIKCK